jgi:hypothetical protein
MCAKKIGEKLFVASVALVGLTLVTLTFILDGSDEDSISNKFSNLVYDVNSDEISVDFRPSFKLHPGNVAAFVLPDRLRRVHPSDWPPRDLRRWLSSVSYHPWPSDPACSNYSITFSRSSLELRALASFPASGNTWLRYLVEAGTGVFTGSVYEDTYLASKGHLGEMLRFDSGVTILQKTHGMSSHPARSGLTL